MTEAEQSNTEPVKDRLNNGINGLWQDLDLYMRVCPLQGEKVMTAVSYPPFEDDFENVNWGHYGIDKRKIHPESTVHIKVGRSTTITFQVTHGASTEDNPPISSVTLAREDPAGSQLDKLSGMLTTTEANGIKAHKVLFGNDIEKMTLETINGARHILLRKATKILDLNQLVNVYASLPDGEKISSTKRSDYIFAIGDLNRFGDHEFYDKWHSAIEDQLQEK